ncbi:MAG: LptF/LptG family permease [Verrucomicrobia bacterium]|nr:LptF/LptG family permease [Verrucomicrobiota bacterium]NDE63109.1 LptF/LptG family permease [Chlamydiota bacterium]
MPVLWRTYFRAFIPTFLFYTIFLTLLSFLFRFKELVFFLDSGASAHSLCRFVLFNIPFFFTLACPLSAAISGYLVSNRLSQFGEWTALSTLGIPKKLILLPPIIVGLHLFFIVFAINADICPKYRLLGKRIVLDAIYQNPTLIFKHFQPKNYPIAVCSIQKNGQNDFSTVLVGGKKEGEEHLDLTILKNLSNTTSVAGFQADAIFQIIHQNEGKIITKMGHSDIEGSTIPTQFHFPKGYEEHIPIRANLSFTEFCRRICISLLPMMLFFLTTAFGISKHRRTQDKQLLICILVSISSYFCYLTVRSSVEPNFWAYLLIPFLSLPFTLNRLKKELR